MRLDQRFAPQRVHDIVGQDLSDIEIWLDQPFSRCLLFYGAGGTGKTTAALAIVKELGISDYDYHLIEMGTANKQSLDFVVESMRYRPMKGKWRLFHFEEFERMSQESQILLKTKLDINNMPEHVIVVACSNSLGKLDDALVQRFDLVKFHNDQAFRDACEDKLIEVWNELLPNVTPPPESNRWGITHTNSFSMRVALRDLDRFYRKEKSLCRC